MPDLRYVGSATWSRVRVNKEGKFDGFDAIEPNDIVEFDNKEADHFAGEHIPRQNRIFVLAGGPEDPLKDDYEEVILGGNATPTPKLDMGSTSPGGIPQFTASGEQPTSSKKASTTKSTSSNASSSGAQKSE